MLIDVGAQVLRAPKSSIAVGRRQSGQPWVRADAGLGAHVSVSHCRGLVAVAASRACPVGVDVELRRAEPVTALAERWFDATEVSWLRRQPENARADAFLMLWTAKEAVGKALGLGLRHSGLRRRMPLGPARAQLRPLPAAHHLLVAHPSLRPDAVLAVALAGATPDIEITVTQPRDHDTAARSAAELRTSLPVAVRGS